MTTRNKDDAIRRVVKLIAKRDSSTFEEEKKACQGGITAMRRKWDITDDDLEDYGSDEDRTFLGFTISADVDRRYKRYQRMQREVLDSIMRFQAHLAQDDAWADERTFVEIEAQLMLAKQQTQRCDSCRERGYGPLGMAFKFKNGKTPGGRQRYSWYHKECRADWEVMAKRHFEEQGRPINAEDFGL